VSERAVQKHVTAIFDKLGLAPGEDDNRRILAVLLYLRSAS
jgi:DNA-binding NarL/FixJ family response regulator